MDRFEGMSMLLAVVDHGCFSAASRSLRVPVATLSRKVSELEARVGAQLLIRTTRKLTLTGAGINYVASARRILDQVEETEREAAGEFMVPKGELVVSAPILFGRLHLLPVITEFLAQYLDINIRLKLADRNVDLIDDRVDMAVRIGKLPDSEMVARRIGSMRTVVCGSPDLIKRYGLASKPEDLQHLPCVSVEAPQPSPGWSFGSPSKVIDIRPRLSVTTAEAAKQAAIRGVGVTRLLHYQVADAVEDGKLALLLEEYEPNPAPVHLIHAARGDLPLKMRRFLDFSAPRLQRAIRGLEQSPQA